MTKKKPASKKPATKKRATKSQPKKIIKEIITVDEKCHDGYWTKTTVVKYAKQLLCPAFLNDKIILYLAAIPLGILVLLILWKVLSYE